MSAAGVVQRGGGVLPPGCQQSRDRASGWAGKMRAASLLVLLGAACCCAPSLAHAALSPTLPLAALTALSLTGSLEQAAAGKLDDVKARAAGKSPAPSTSASDS